MPSLFALHKGTAFQSEPIDSGKKNVSSVSVNLYLTWPCAMCPGSISGRVAKQLIASCESQPIYGLLPPILLTQHLLVATRKQHSSRTCASIALTWLTAANRQGCQAVKEHCKDRQTRLLSTQASLSRIIRSQVLSTLSQMVAPTIGNTNCTGQLPTQIHTANTHR